MTMRIEKAASGTRQPGHYPVGQAPVGLWEGGSRRRQVRVQTASEHPTVEAVGMITGTHAIIFAEDADRGRAPSSGTSSGFPPSMPTTAGSSSSSRPPSSASIPKTVGTAREVPASSWWA